MGNTFRIGVIEYFSSAHKLRNYPGKCENLHGHNWKVEVEIGRDELDNTGMVMDFSELRKILKEILVKIDHKILNEIKPYDNINPTSENIAKHIYYEVSKQIPIKLRFVKVWENEFSYAVYKG